MKIHIILIYILCMAGVTYLVRMLPLVFFKKKIHNRFIKSFLYYVPYCVLSAMTFPTILYATSSVISAIVGLIAAILLAFSEKSLIACAISSCVCVYLTELILSAIR